MDHQDVKLMSKTSTNSSPDNDLDNSTAKIDPEVTLTGQHSDDQTESSIMKPKIIKSMFPKEQTKGQFVKVQPKGQQKEKKDPDQPLDVIIELVQKQNPLPLLAVLDQVDLYKKTSDGVPLFNLLMNKFLPLPELLDNSSIKFEKDEDGRTPLHYAIEADDVKAAEWLLSKGARNESDKFGNTPVMDSVRLGHKRCFLLCLHYQHVNQELPHIAAQYNRVWQLKCMLALGLSLQKKNNNEKTPLEVAVQSYSYEAAQYLAYVTDNYLISSISTLTDSKAIIRRVHQGAQNSSTLHRAILPLLYKIIQIMIILSVVNYSHYFQRVSQLVNYNIAIMLITQLLMASVGWALRNKIKTPQSITKLLHEPYFPNNLDHVCPSCFNRYHPQKQQHCQICRVCVPKLHQHHYMCINKHNQTMWYIQQYLYLFTLYTIVTKTVAFTLQSYPPAVPFQSLLPRITNFSYTVYHMHQSQQSYILPIVFIFIAGLFVKQCLFCLQLFGMAFMNRTYKQVTNSEKYPHLYTVFKSTSGKIKSKEFRIFGKYKLCGGICVGIRNIFRFFIC